MRRHVLSLVVLAGLAGLALTGLGCDLVDPVPNQQLMVRAPALVTKGGLPDIGRLCRFQSDKFNTKGVIDYDARMTADKFTDFLGYADYLFGYNLEIDTKNGVFTGYARVIASVEYNGTTYVDTVWMPANSVKTSKSEYTPDTLRIDLPAK